jgi:hypothetical protein
VAVLLIGSELESGLLLGIVTLYGLDGPGMESRCGEIFSVPGARPASCMVGTVFCFPGVDRPWSGGDSPLRSSAKVKERVELCVLFVACSRVN